MNGFERRKERKKESIRNAALELFKSYGFDKITINDIAREAHVSQVTIYNHFGNKDELINQVIKDFMIELVRRYHDLIKSDRPFPEKLEYIFTDKLNIASQFNGDLMRKAIQWSPDIKTFIESLWENDITKLVIDLFTFGKKEGYVDKDMSTESIMAYYEVMRRGFYYSPDVIDKMAKDITLTKEIIALFIYGLNG